VTPTSPLFGPADIRALLEDLGKRLDDRGIEARLFLVGGAAMALAYGRDRVTRDLDAVFVPKAEIYEEAKRMAKDRGLPDDWLNDAVKGLLSRSRGADRGLDQLHHSRSPPRCVLR